MKRVHEHHFGADMDHASREVDARPNAEEIQDHEQCHRANHDADDPHTN